MIANVVPNVPCGNKIKFLSNDSESIERSNF